MLYEVSYMSAAGIPSIIHVNADGIERAQAYFCETEKGAEFCGIREGASSSRPGVPSVTVPADWQPREIETAGEGDEIGEKFATVGSMAAAWALADKLFPTDYMRDSERSARAGYPVYHSTAAGVNAYICDLGDRLELNYPDGHSYNIWVKADETSDEAAQIDNSEDKGGSAPVVKLANLIPLKSKITVYVPSTVNVSEAIDNSAQVERVARLLSECFGGATASPVSGYWVAADKSLVVEHTTMVFAFCDTASAEKYIDDVVRLCVSLKHEMGQEAIAMEYNGDMYFI